MVVTSGPEPQAILDELSNEIDWLNKEKCLPSETPTRWRLLTRSRRTPVSASWVGLTQAWRHLCAPGSARFVPTGFYALDSGCPISD